MSYLTEAFNYIVPSHDYHTNNAHLVISDEYQIDRIKKDENCGSVDCSIPPQQSKLTEHYVSPSVSCNDFEHLP